LTAFSKRNSCSCFAGSTFLCVLWLFFKLFPNREPLVSDDIVLDFCYKSCFPEIFIEFFSSSEIKKSLVFDLKKEFLSKGVFFLLIGSFKPALLS